MNYKKLISQAIAQKSDLESESILSAIETPPDKKLGDYAFPCFMLAKAMKKSPVQISVELSKELELPKGIERIESQGPYINFFVAVENTTSIIDDIRKSGRQYGIHASQNKKFMVEFFHANTHKGVHIGHVRNICLGESLCRILEASGIEVIRVNYQGDIGPHVAKAVWGYLNFYKGKEPKTNRGVWLGKVYAEANKKIKVDENLQEEIRELTKNIYDSDKYTKIWKETRQWCLDDFDEMYKQFDVKYDRLYFESEVEKSGREIIQQLLKEKVAIESEGAIIVDYKDEGMGVFVVLRSDGVPLYSTKDLALAELKAKEYPKIDMSIHVVGKEQELYFKQLFRTFEKYGGPLAGKSYHMIYELVMLPEGKMSSREGTVVLYEDLRSRLIEYAKAEVEKRHSNWKEEQVDDTSEKIAFAALKFSMLNRDNNKTLVFDWKKAIDFEGETGPYLQYTVTRINSIMEKHGRKIGKVDLSVLVEEEEKQIMLHLAKFPNVIKDAAEHYKPLLITKYLVETAQMFNEFYHKHPVLKAEEKIMNARLALIDAIRQVMENGLKLLAIETVKQM